MKKALILTNQSGFLWKFELENVLLLQSLGFIVHYASNSAEEGYHYNPSDIERMGVIYHDIPVARSPYMWRMNFDAFRLLKDIVENEEIDLIQIATRSMQNYELLRELGRMNKPVVLKRGLSNRLKELLVSAEYIMASGNERVILCERGIRTFSDYTRNTLDLSAVPMLHELTHLPVIVDPSHATGIARLVPPMALAGAASGAAGLIIEVHNDPMHALCDGAQSLREQGVRYIAGIDEVGRGPLAGPVVAAAVILPEDFDVLSKKVRAVREAIA